MDLQTFENIKVQKAFIINSIDNGINTISIVKYKQFLKKVEIGDILIIEFPLCVESRYCGGTKSFSIEVHHPRTLNSLKMRSTKLYENVFRWLELKEIDI